MISHPEIVPQPIGTTNRTAGRKLILLVDWIGTLQAMDIWDGDYATELFNQTKKIFGPENTKIVIASSGAIDSIRNYLKQYPHPELDAIYSSTEKRLESPEVPQTQSLSRITPTIKATVDEKWAKADVLLVDDEPHKFGKITEVSKALGVIPPVSCENNVIEFLYTNPPGFYTDKMREILRQPV